VVHVGKERGLELYKKSLAAASISAHHRGYTSSEDGTLSHIHMPTLLLFHQEKFAHPFLLL
jgi:hypothetical protein